MKKVRILSSYDSSNLEMDVNNFVIHHNVVDIQFSASKGYGGCIYACMIRYEDD